MAVVAAGLPGVSPVAAQSDVPEGMEEIEITPVFDRRPCGYTAYHDVEDRGPGTYSRRDLLADGRGGEILLSDDFLEPSTPEDPVPEGKRRYFYRTFFEPAPCDGIGPVIDERQQEFETTTFRAFFRPPAVAEPDPELSVRLNFPDTDLTFGAEDFTVLLTVEAGDQPITGIAFSADPIASDGAEVIGPATPPLDAPFDLAAGESRLFRFTMRGTSLGDVFMTSTPSGTAPDGSPVSASVARRVTIVPIELRLDVVSNLDDDAQRDSNLYEVELTISNAGDEPVAAQLLNDSGLYVRDIPADLRGLIEIVDGPYPVLPSEIAAGTTQRVRYVIHAADEGLASLAAAIGFISETGKEFVEASGFDSEATTWVPSEEEKEPFVADHLTAWAVGSAGHPHFQEMWEITEMVARGDGAAVEEYLAYLAGQSRGFAEAWAEFAEPFGVGFGYYLEMGHAAVTGDYDRLRVLVDAYAAEVGNGVAAGTAAVDAFMTALWEDPGGTLSDLGSSIASSVSAGMDRLNAKIEERRAVIDRLIADGKFVEANEETGRLAGWGLGALAIELVLEMTGMKVADSAYRRMFPDDVNGPRTRSDLPPPGPEADGPPAQPPRNPSDAEIAAMEDADRWLEIARRQRQTDELAEMLPPDEIILLDELAAVGGILESDAIAAQNLVARLNQKYRDMGYDIDIELGARSSNPWSHRYYDSAEGATPKNGLAKAKSGSEIDLVLGMHRDGLGIMTVYKPIDRAQLDDVLSTLPPARARELELRWETQDANWRGYEEFVQWRDSFLAADFDDAPAFDNKMAQRLVETARPDRPHSAPSPLGGSEPDTMWLRPEPVGNGNTVRFRDRSNDDRFIVSDIDWHSVINVAGDGKLPSSVRAQIYHDLIDGLRKDTKSFGGHGLSLDGSDLLGGIAPIRLEYIYESLPPWAAEMLLLIRGDDLDLDGIVTGGLIFKIREHSFSQGFSGLPGPGWFNAPRSNLEDLHAAVVEP